MRDFERFLDEFGVPDAIADNVVRVRVRDHYYWALLAEGDRVTTYCAFDRNHIYDGLDETLVEKITTGKDLVFSNRELGQTIVIEEFVNRYDDSERIYIATSMRNLRCVFSR